MKYLLIAVAVLVVAFGATTWWALESAGVAMIETQAPDGAPRLTHVWFVKADEELWLEAGKPENPWFRDVQENPILVFKAGRRYGRYVAMPVEGPAGHDRIRSMIREKYGFRDRWVGLIVDTSRSVAVRLLPAES